MATAIELAQKGIHSVVLEKRGPVGSRENLFNVTPPLADRLAALDPEGSLTGLLVPTERLTSEDAVTGASGERRFTTPVEPDPTRSRGDMNALVSAIASPSAEGTDLRRWSKVAISDLENGLRQLATTRHADMIELRSDTAVESIRQTSDWVEAVLAPAAESGARDAVRGAMLVDATGVDLLGGSRTVYPEQSHWLGGRFEPPKDGTTATLRRRALTPDSADPLVSIKLPSTDRTIVWAQLPGDGRSMSDDARAALIERRAASLGVDGTLTEPRRTMPVSVQLWTSDEPARGRVLKVGDSVRAPYFPTSTGAAAAIIHDASHAVDAISSVLDGSPVAAAAAAYSDAVKGANEQLMGASRHAMLADLGLQDSDAGAPAVVEREPVSASSP
jgi:2-polyprenyl-6-methoxyphenol hydroxylase-like FAD-dependent oxidoreductase